MPHPSKPEHVEGSVRNPLHGVQDETCDSLPGPRGRFPSGFVAPIQPNHRVQERDDVHVRLIFPSLGITRLCSSSLDPLLLILASGLVVDENSSRSSIHVCDADRPWMRSFAALFVGRNGVARVATLSSTCLVTFAISRTNPYTNPEQFGAGHEMPRRLPAHPGRRSG